MTLTGKALKEMKDIGRKAGLVPDVGSLFKTKNPSTKQKNTPQTQQIFHEGWGINCALQEGGNRRTAAD